MNRLLMLASFVLIVASCKKDIDKDIISTREVLIMQDSCYCFLPNAFSPDGNGLNDLLSPLSNNLESSNYMFTIRDLKQKILFTSNTIGEAWTGDNKPIGLYIATVKGTLSCGTSFEEHTCVNLINDCIGNYLDINKLVFESMFSPVTASIIFPSGEGNCP